MKLPSAILRENQFTYLTNMNGVCWGTYIIQFVMGLLLRYIIWQCLLKETYCILLGKLLYSYLIVWLWFIFNSGMSQSYTNQRDKNLAKVTGYDANNRRFGERNSESSTMSVNQVHWGLV